MSRQLTSQKLKVILSLFELDINASQACSSNKLVLCTVHSLLGRSSKKSMTNFTPLLNSFSFFFLNLHIWANFVDPTDLSLYYL